MKVVIEKNRVNNCCMVCLKVTKEKNITNIVIRQDGLRGITCPVCSEGCPEIMLARIERIPADIKVTLGYLRKYVFGHQPA